MWVTKGSWDSIVDIIILNTKTTINYHSKQLLKVTFDDNLVVYGKLQFIGRQKVFNLTFIKDFFEFKSL